MSDLTDRLRAENAALKRDLQYARDGLTKGRTRMREDNERLRDALESIRDICDEEWHVRGNDSRITEIRGIARAVLEESRK